MSLYSVLFITGCHSQPKHQAASPPPSKPARVTHSSRGTTVDGRNQPLNQTKNNQSPTQNLIKATRKMTPQEKREFGQFLDSQGMIPPPQLKKELQRK